jgi:hypothetical protein
MTRRRLITVIALAVLAVGLAWWLWPDGLSAEEERLVGTWREVTDNPGNNFTVTFTPDRGWTHLRERRTTSHTYSGRWSLRGAELTVDREPNRIGRTLRPVALFLGLRVGPVSRMTAEVGAERLIITEPDGTRTVYTRAPAD